MAAYTRVCGSYNTYSEPRMRAAFEAVQSTNWKDPIDAEIDVDDLCVTAAAVEFFAGSEMYVRRLESGRFHVKAPGYYARIGA